MGKQDLTHTMGLPGAEAHHQAGEPLLDGVPLAFGDCAGVRAVLIQAVSYVCRHESPQVKVLACAISESGWTTRRCDW